MKILSYIACVLFGLIVGIVVYTPIVEYTKQIKKELSECKSYSLGLEQIIKNHDKDTSKQIIKNIQNEQNCKNK